LKQSRRVQKGYILKDYSSSRIIEAIRSVSRDEAFFDPRSSGKVLSGLKTQFGDQDAAREVPLSRREIEILKLIAEGCINKEISKKLCISIHTVRNHIANIFSRLSATPGQGDKRGSQEEPDLNRKG